MNNQPRYAYNPDFVLPPGVHIESKIEEMGLSQTELAERIGRTKKTVNEIIAGKAPIEPETALQLERVLNIPARFWNNAERIYRDHLVRKAETERLQQQQGRLKDFPVTAMRRLGWLPKRNDPIETLTDLLTFFGVASFESLDEIDERTWAAFRQSVAERVNRGSALAWLRRGEMDGRAAQCQPFARDKFRTSLARIRDFAERPFAELFDEARGLCGEAGVALVSVPTLPGVPARGATRWLSPEKALLQVTPASKADRRQWFTLLHEAGHILLHPKKDIFIELPRIEDRYENEANRFAADLLAK